MVVFLSLYRNIACKTLLFRAGDARKLSLDVGSIVRWRDIILGNNDLFAEH
jgi:hypothetical protein